MNKNTQTDKHESEKNPRKVRKRNAVKCRSALRETPVRRRQVDKQVRLRISTHDCQHHFIPVLHLDKQNSRRTAARLFGGRHIRSAVRPQIRHTSIDRLAAWRSG